MWFSEQHVICQSYHGQCLLPALVETIGQRAYFSVEKYCWRLFNLASLNVSEKVKFAKFAKYKGFTVNRGAIRDVERRPGTFYFTCKHTAHFPESPRQAVTMIKRHTFLSRFCAGLCYYSSVFYGLLFRYSLGIKIDHFWLTIFRSHCSLQSVTLFLLQHICVRSRR